MLAATYEADTDPAPDLGTVAWTRGEGCLPLAEVLADEQPVALGSDLARSCVEDRVDFLVTRRASRFDLIPTAVPSSIDLSATTSVTAAIGVGPHSELAAQVAARLAAKLGVPGELSTVLRSGDASSTAMRKLGQLAERFPHLTARAMEGTTARALIETLSPSTLLVVGAPGGSWFQRQIVGSGHRLLAAAPAGAIVVKSAPRRCYQDAVGAHGVAVSPLLALADARSLVSLETVPVAHEGRLVGILRGSATTESPFGRTVADVMEPAVAVDATEPASAARELIDFLGRGPIPVVGGEDRLLGVIPHATALTNEERPT